MFAAFLLTKLFRHNKIPVFSTKNPATLLQNNSLFLRHISSNTSSAQSPSELSTRVLNPSAAVGSASSKKSLGDSSVVTKKELNRDYTVSYLVESRGLSPKDAASASEKVHFATPERPDSFLHLLRNYGFTSTQIAKMVRIRPRLLLFDAEETILPKLEYFHSMGLSKHDLAEVVSSNPGLLARSLTNHIEPVCSLIKKLVQSDERVCTVVRRSPWLLLKDYEKFIVPKIELLQKLGVSASSISLFVTHFPRVLTLDHEQFSAGVSKVKEMGFDPSKSTFVLALQVLSGKGSEMIWARCHKIYSTKWGWSEEDILSAFKKHPSCMTFSEKKVNSSMEYLANTMCWSSKYIALQPTVLTYSLEKRIIPRCSVIRVLWTKGLLRKDLSPGSVLKPVERDFLKRYVTKYEKEVPQLLSVYEGEMDPLDL